MMNLIARLYDDLGLSHGGIGRRDCRQEAEETHEARTLLLAACCLLLAAKGQLDFTCQLATCLSARYTDRVGLKICITNLTEGMRAQFEEEGLCELRVEHDHHTGHETTLGVALLKFFKESGQFFDRK